MQNNTKLKLSDVRVIFFTPLDDEKVTKKGYKPNFTIALSPEQIKEVTEFVKSNGVGKNGDPDKGVAKIVHYVHPDTGVATDQFTIKYTDKTQWAGLNGLGYNDMGPGATVNVIINAFPYYRFNGGIAMNASAVVLTKGTASANAEDDLAELMSDLGDDGQVDEAQVVPF